MLVGDFNLIRSPDDRNREGGDAHNMMLFNNVIQSHDLMEVPLKGRTFTWSNMQDPPLLEKLDWIFTCPSWTTTFPNTMAHPLSRIGSDHTPISIQVGTSIPKAQLFRFENHWLEFDGFYDTVNTLWNSSPYISDTALAINFKFKHLRAGLKKWCKKHSNLNQTIENYTFILALLEGIEDQRPLALHEKNFKMILMEHTNKLLEAKRIYWKSRAKIRWAKLGDENTKIFHVVAT